MGLPREELQGWLQGVWGRGSIKLTGVEVDNIQAMLFGVAVEGDERRPRADDPPYLLHTEP